MKYQELIVLLPCHSLEDFPTHHAGEEAQSLLSAWSVLWHPALIASAEAAPVWKRLEDPPQELAGRLLTVPTFAASRLPTGYAQRAKEEGAVLIRKTNCRKEILEIALADLPEAANISAELTADFLALGYAFLQVQLLTRQTRYSSNLDEPFFYGQVVAAAQAAVQGDEVASRQKLSICFNLLGEERDHYFPVDAFLLDLTLVAETTLGSNLREELADTYLTNLFLGPETLQAMAQREPETLSAVRQRIEASNIGLIGGGRENRWPLLSLESIADDLRAGLSQYEQLLGKRPTVFGRQRFGLSPWVGSLLKQFGFDGACHFGLEDGTTPAGMHLAVQWESPDDRAIDVLSKPPLDASLPETFLQLASKLGEVLDSESVAAVVLAHWPGQAAEWLHDLRRISMYSRALGQFDTIENFLSQVASLGQLEKFDADQYRSPYLKQAIVRRQNNPVSTNRDYWQQLVLHQAIQTFHALTDSIRGELDATRPTLPLPSENNAPTNHSSPDKSKGDPAENLRNDPAESTNGELADSPHDDSADSSNGDSLGNSLSAANVQQAAEALARALTGGDVVPADKAAGFLVLNPFSHVRRQGADLPLYGSVPQIEKPIYAASPSETSVHVVADVPAMGYVWIPRSSGGKPTQDRPLAEDNVLRNEFFEAVINPVTGALSAVRDYNARGNRLSQQIALRMPGKNNQKPGDVYRDPDETAVYSVMGADEITTTIATPAVGEIVVRSRLMDLSGKRLGGCTTTYRLYRGSRVLNIRVVLDPAEEPRADPWNSYYCCRFAWGEDDPDIVRTVHQMGVATNLKRFESPHYIELLGATRRTTILTGGLPFHRRHLDRMLDTLLVTRNEQQREFQLGIGVDLAHPLHDALALLTPSSVVPTNKAPASGNSGWLFHLDARNVVATAWEAISDPPVGGGTSQKVQGIRLRLLETEGRSSKLKITTFRELKAAKRTDMAGNPGREIAVEADSARLEIEPYSWQQIELIWG